MCPWRTIDAKNDLTHDDLWPCAAALWRTTNAKSRTEISEIQRALVRINEFKSSQLPPPQCR